MTIVSRSINKILKNLIWSHNIHILYVHTYKSFSKYVNTFVKYCTYIYMYVNKYLRAKKMVVGCD